MKYRRLIPVLVVGCCCVSVCAQAPNDLTNAELATELRENIAYWEAMLKRDLRLLKKRAVSASKVDQLRANLCKWKHDLAGIENDEKEMEKQTRELLEIRKRKAERWEALRKAGYASEYQTNEAQRQLAVNRYLVARIDGDRDVALRELRRTVSLCQQEVALREKALAKKQTVRARVNWARNRLVCAKYQLARATNNVESITTELSELVEALRHDWQRMETLYDQRMTTYVELYFSHVFFINAMVRKSSLEGKNQVVEELLEQQITLHENVLKRGRESGWHSGFTARAKQSLDRSIASALRQDRKRLEQVKETGQLGDDLTLAELDP